MSDDALFTHDCYGCVLILEPFGDPLPDWLGIEVRRDDLPDDEQRVGYNAIQPDQIEALRDALTAWLDDHPVRPDPFTNGGEVECAIGGDTYLVSVVGEDQP